MMVWRVLLLCIFATGICAFAQPVVDAAQDNASKVYIHIEGNVSTDIVTPLKEAGVDGIMFATVDAAYDGAGGWMPRIMNISAFKPGDLDGLSVLLLVKLSLWDKGWDGEPPLIVLAQMLGDMTSNAVRQTEMAGGKVTGISIISTDANPSLTDLAQLVKWMRNNPAYGGGLINFGIVTDESLFLAESFDGITDSIDYAVIKIEDASQSSLDRVMAQADDLNILSLIMLPGDGSVDPGVIGNISSASSPGRYFGIVLDGVPGESRLAEYISAAGGTTAEEPGSKTLRPPTEEQMTADRRTFNKAFWMVAILALIGCAIAGLTVLKKRNLEYDEESGDLKRKGGNKD